VTGNGTPQAIYVSQSNNPVRARRQVGEVLDRILEGLRPRPAIIIRDQKKPASLARSSAR